MSKKNKTLKVDAENKFLFSSASKVIILELHNGTIALADEDELYLISSVDLKVIKKFSIFTITTMVLRPNGNIAIGHNNGDVSFLDPHSKQLEKSKFKGKSNSIVCGTILNDDSLLMASENSMFYKFKPHFGRIPNEAPIQIKIKDGSFPLSIKEIENNLYVGYSNQKIIILGKKSNSYCFVERIIKLDINPSQIFHTEGTEVFQILDENSIFETQLLEVDFNFQQKENHSSSNIHLTGDVSMIKVDDEKYQVLNGKEEFEMIIKEEEIKKILKIVPLYYQFSILIINQNQMKLYKLGCGTIPFPTKFFNNKFKNVNNEIIQYHKHMENQIQKFEILRYFKKSAVDIVIKYLCNGTIDDSLFKNDFLTVIDVYFISIECRLFNLYYLCIRFIEINSDVFPFKKIYEKLDNMREILIKSPVSYALKLMVLEYSGKFLHKQNKYLDFHESTTCEFDGIETKYSQKYVLNSFLGDLYQHSFDSDVILKSKDYVFFKVHQCIIRRFQTFKDATDAVKTDFTKETLEMIIQIMYSQPLILSGSIEDSIELYSFLIENYDEEEDKDEEILYINSIINSYFKQIQKFIDDQLEKSNYSSSYDLCIKKKLISNDVIISIFENKFNEIDNFQTSLKIFKNFNQKLKEENEGILIKQVEKWINLNVNILNQVIDEELATHILEAFSYHSKVPLFNIFKYVATDSLIQISKIYEAISKNEEEFASCVYIDPNNKQVQQVSKLITKNINLCFTASRNDCLKLFKQSVANIKNREIRFMNFSFYINLLNYFSRKLITNCFKTKINELLKSNGILYLEFYQNFEDIQSFPQLKSSFFSIFKEKSENSIVVIQNQLKDEQVYNSFKMISIEKQTEKSLKRGRKPGSKMTSPIVKTESKKKKLKKEVIEIEDDEFFVEKILDSRKNHRDGTFEYLLKWEGYDVNWNEWIHESKCNCDELITEYWSNKTLDI
eukprot:gene12906-7418_t